MDITIKSIQNYKYICRKTIFLRLCERTYYRSTTNYTWILHKLQSFTKDHKHLYSYHKHENSSANELLQNNLTEINEYIPEHKIIHSMFENNKLYHRSIMQPIKAIGTILPEEISQLYITDWSSENAQNIFSAIKKLTYCCLSGSCFEASLFDCIFRALNPNLSELQDQQIKMLLQCLIVLRDMVKQLDTYKKIVVALNKECLTRFYSSDKSEMLSIVDAFYQLQHSESAYAWRALRKIGTNPHKLSSKELVQLLFYVKFVHLKFLNMFEIECSVQELLPEFSIDELGIIARGFFLSKRTIRNKDLLLHIIKKSSEHHYTWNGFSLTSILKIIRYSNYAHHRVSIHKLLTSLCGRTSHLPLVCLTHMTQTFGAARVYNRNLTDEILERVINEIQNTRLKDIERVVYGICSVTPSTKYYTDMCHKMLNEILSSYKDRRASEIENYPASLIRILVFLVCKNIYEPELIPLVFNSAFIQNMHKNHLRLLTNELLVLHCSVKIDLPYYEGPLLKPDLYEYLTQKFSHSDDVIRKDINLTFRIEVIYICQNKLGINAYADHILPHYEVRDIVFGMDEHKNPVEVESILSTMPTSSIKSVNNNELKKIKWKVLLLLPNNARVFGSDNYIGILCTKFRQLKAIGYTPIPVSEEKWKSYIGEDEKANYLKELIFQETDYEM